MRKRGFFFFFFLHAGLNYLKHSISKRNFENDWDENLKLAQFTEPVRREWGLCVTNHWEIITLNTGVAHRRDICVGFPGGSAGKEAACGAGDPGSVPALGRSPGEGKGHPPQHYGLKNSRDGIVHGAMKSQTRQRLSLSVTETTETISGQQTVLSS